MTEMSTYDVDTSKARQSAELDLLQAMYPSQIHFHRQRQELTYTSSSGMLTLRLPDHYPEQDRPILLSASSSKSDMREETRSAIAEQNLPEGEEMLDAIIQCFEDLLARQTTDSEATSQAIDWSKTDAEEPNKTVIIYLHHLLNTNKRKLALTPSSGADNIAGVTKPGYPGVLIYSGKAGAVDGHVAELKAQRWQAFQVRLEKVVQSPWSFSFGRGIKEVESMAEVTEAIVGDANKEEFLKAMKVK